MQRYRIPLAAAAISTLAAAADHDALLKIRPQVATLMVAAESGAKRQIIFPQLEISVQIEAACPPGRNVESLTISIADTRETIRPVPAAAVASLATTLAVSGRQLSPLVVEQFCTTAGPPRPAKLHIESAMSAHASLRCGGADGASMHYRSNPVGIDLICNGNDVPGAGDRHIRNLPW